MPAVHNNSEEVCALVNMPVADDLSVKEKNVSEGVQSSDAPERLVLRLRFSRS